MKPAVGSGQAHITKCSTQVGSCHKVFRESPLLSSAVLPGMGLEGGSWPRLGACWRLLKQFNRIDRHAPVPWSWVMLAQTQQQATSRKKY